MAVAVGAFVGGACSDHEDGLHGAAGSACDVPSECYPDADHETLSGDIVCLADVPGGYCTHLCGTDADCCAADGECPTDHPQVCAPFQSTGMMMCFLSCEDSVLDGADGTAYCEDNAHTSFGCRSTGGGSQNRKVCVP